MLTDGPINGFRLYVEKVLLPTLKPGDIVLIDKAVRHAVSNAGAKLFFLPKYSPDLIRSRCSSPNQTPAENGRQTQHRRRLRASGKSTTLSHQRNAPTPSPRPSMPQPKIVTL